MPTLTLAVNNEPIQVTKAAARAVSAAMSDTNRYVSFALVNEETADILRHVQFTESILSRRAADEAPSVPLEAIYEQMEDPR